MTSQSIGKLTVTRGLPASGKTTVARKMVELRQVLLDSLEPGELPEEPARLARVNRDDLRAMLHVGDWSPAKETITRNARNAIIGVLLYLGVDVVCDDTNLTEDEFDELKALATSVEAGFSVVDLRDVPVEECIRRDQLRPNGVGRAVIERLAEHGGLV